ncbi:MAG: hypothetical protein WB781_00485, partial [Candidatus Sulfotelmatobacter sp.]
EFKCAAGGTKVQIVEMNSKKLFGTFVNLSDTAMACQECAGEQTIRKQDVRSVKLMKNKHRLCNTPVLEGAGAGVGAGIGAATYHPCSSQSFCLDIGGRALPTAIGAAIGFVGGAVAGALLPSHKTICRVNSQQLASDH